MLNRTTTDFTALVAQAQAIVGKQAVVTNSDALRTYDADASMIVSHAPRLVVLPSDEQQAAALVRLAGAAGVPLVARGAGTGIAGGAIPLHGGMLVSTSRMERVLAVEARSRRALVQPGVVNAELNARLAVLNMQFAPDPSSQRASTIGGNLGTNAGGPHCLKYGVTTNHILAVELVLPDGTLLWTGDGCPDLAGYDLTGLVVGSEGTFGLVTRVWVRLTPLPEANRVVLALFPSVIAASAAVSAVIAAGSLPTALEVMDHNAIRAVNSAYSIGLPESVGTTLLIIEVDGVVDGLDEQLEQILQICREQGAFELRPARTPEEQARVWAARKSVAGAIGRLAPAYYLIDTVVPRTRLPLMMEHVERLRLEHQLEICNVFHAGDGNLHPLVLYDPRDADQSRRAHAIAQGVLDLSIAQGGVVSGEHGIGVEKQEYLPRMFSPAELQMQATVATLFNPGECFNPAKIFPADQPPAQLAAARRTRLAAVIVRESAAGLADELRAIVGSAALLEGEMTAAYTRSEMAPDLVAQPADHAEAAAVVAACARAGAAVVAWGGGTQQRIGGVACAPNARPLVALQTTRLNAVHTYEPDDLTIGVDAGTTFAQLRALTLPNRQLLPWEPSDPRRATIGGMLAAATNGPRRLGYGTPRDWALALTVIEPDGTLLRLGAQVVKNVTGYDLVRMHIGALGTLGVIVAAGLKLFPQPPATVSVVIDFANRRDALATLDDLALSRLQPTACDLVHGIPAISSAPWALLIHAEGHPAAVERHIRELGELAAAHGGELRAYHDSAERALWDTVYHHAAVSSAPDEILLRISCAPADLGATLERINAVAGKLAPRIVARALTGSVQLRIHGERAVLRGVNNNLITTFGHVHRLAGGHNWPESRWGTALPSAGLMDRLRQTIDPWGTFSPGRSGW